MPTPLLFRGTIALRCDGSGWIIVGDEHISCPGCHGCPENMRLMDDLEEAEERFIHAIVEDECPDPDDLLLLTGKHIAYI